MQVFASQVASCVGCRESCFCAAYITGWAVYFGNNEYYSSQTGLNGQLDVTINNAPLGAGQQVTITAFDNTGATKSYVATNISVVAFPLPAIPSNATAFTNLQVQVKQPSSADQGGLGATTLAAQVQVRRASAQMRSISASLDPSLSGASMLQTINGPYCNILNYRKFACPQSGCKAIKNLLEDMWFQTRSTNQMQGSEFDPDLFDGVAEYQLSTQCRLLSAPGTAAGVWYLWNMNAPAWEPTQYPCTAATIAPGTWHHYQLYGTVNTGTPGSQTQTYQTACRRRLITPANRTPQTPTITTTTTFTSGSQSGEEEAHLLGPFFIPRSKLFSFGVPVKRLRRPED